MPALKEPRRAERGTCTFFISYNRTVHTVRYLRPATRAKVYTGTGTGTVPVPVYTGTVYTGTGTDLPVSCTGGLGSKGGDTITK